MFKRRVVSAAVIVLGASAMSVSGCGHDHPHEADEHGTGSANTGEHDDLAAQAVTIWAGKTELFMEYEPLIVGRASRFAAHLTTLNDFKAVTSGVLSLTVRMGDGTELKARAESPSSPGIFRFNISPPKSGSCAFYLAYEGQGIQDAIDAGTCAVFADLKAARAGLPEEGEGGIAYTKEQQWKTDFETAAIRERSLQPSVQATGEVRPMSGREARLTAPARGRLIVASPVPLPGMTVKEGQLLATVSPYLAAGGDRSTLDAEAQSARAELAVAKSQLARLERLHNAQAVPEKRVEEAYARVNVAKARLDAATGRRLQYNRGADGIGGSGTGAFQLRSAIDGTLVEVHATSGDSVEEGRLLFVVIDLSRVWLVARVFEPDIPKVESAKTAWFTVEGYEQPFTIDEDNGRLITVGHVIDPESRTVPVIYELENPDGRIRIGQFARVSIATGEPRKMIAVPASALLDDGGKQIVFVQTEGETFVRRVLRTGIRAKEWVEVTDGIQAGDRVVTRGAYEIRLAAASGAIPERGHVH